MYIFTRRKVVLCILFIFIKFLLNRLLNFTLDLLMGHLDLLESLGWFHIRLGVHGPWGEIKRGEWLSPINHHEGDIPVILLGVLLQANSAWARNWSNDLRLDLIKVLKSTPEVLLVTSVCLFAWGWQVVLYLSLVPNFFHKVTQKWLKNLASLSDTMDLGIPWSLTTSLKYKLAM